MSTKPTTQRYGFIKPTQDDFYDVEDHNKNMDAVELELLAQEAAIKNINLSWDGITGKPTQYPPTAHNHPWSNITGAPTSFPASGGNADTVDGLHANAFMPSNKGDGVMANDLGVGAFLRWKNFGNGHTIIDASAGTSPTGGAINNSNAQNPWSPTYPSLMGWNGSATYGLKVDTSRTADLVKGRDLAAEVDNLKSSVVSGKQEVVNAIHDRAGNLGLTTAHTHADYAWHIRNSIPVVTQKTEDRAISFIFMPRNSNGDFNPTAYTYARYYKYNEVPGDFYIPDDVLYFVTDYNTTNTTNRYIGQYTILRSTTSTDYSGASTTVCKKTGTVRVLGGTSGNGGWIQYLALPRKAVDYIVGKLD